MFLGQAYKRKTAWDGWALIGVATTPDGRFAVYWQTLYGNTYQFNPRVLPVMDSRHAMQLLLDTWAAEKQLEAA